MKSAEEKPKEKILVSLCLCGCRCRYDGKSKPLNHPLLTKWEEEGRLIKVCPEVEGGLATPRPPAQRQGDKVVTEEGRDVTDEYRKGAEKALELARKHRVAFCLMKQKSPSCGSRYIYDGTFSGKLTEGTGLTVELLRAAGFTVIGEEETEKGKEILEKAEKEG